MVGILVLFSRSSLSHPSPSTGSLTRSYISGSLHLERIFDKREQIDHHQHHAQKSHHHTTDSQQVNTIGLGTYVTQYIKQRK